MKKSLLILLISCVLVLMNSINAHSQKALWITTTPDTITQANTWYSFRKNFTLKKLPKKALAQIAVDTRYYMWVNDSLVVLEGGLKRGPNPNDTYFDEIDLSRYLKKGVNNISILVWYWGGKGFSHNSSGRCGLWFNGAFGSQKLVSNNTWKTIQHPAYSPGSRPKPNFRLSEPNLFFDARKDIPGWNSTTFNDKAWNSAYEVGENPAKPWNKLVKRPIPLFRDLGFKDYVSVKREGDIVYCQLPYNCHASPYLKIKAKAGKKIFMRSDTYYLGNLGTDSLYTLCSDYITKEGVQEFENFNWLTGHIIKYTIPTDVEIISLKYRETGYDTDFAGSFACNDTFYNKLWSKAVRTLYVNMGDTYTDCPDRERAQWAGDATMDMEQSFYCLDSKSWALGRKIYSDLTNWQRHDSIMYNPVPEKDWKSELPAHSLMPLAESWEYFLFTRDTMLMKDVYEPFKKYLALWTLGNNGQLVYRKGTWDWGDWGKNTDLVLIQHGWYLKCMQTMEKLALLLDKKSEAELFSALSKKIISFLNSPNCWNGEAYRYSAYKDSTDDRANALMVYTGVADSTKWENIKNVFATQFHASPYMEKYVLESLIKMGEPALALQRMKTRFQPMVNSKFSTLWELWTYDESEGAEHGNSGYNHGWAGGPLILLSKYFAGIAPDEKLPNTYRICPDLSVLTSIKAEFPVKEGILALNASENLIEVFVPAKISAIVNLKKSREISMNGQTIYRNGQLIPNRFVSFAGYNNDRLMFKVPDGKYSFKRIN